MLKRMQISNGKICETDSPECRLQIYIAPGADERKYLTEELNLDEHTLNSALDPDDLARLELKPDQTALIIKRPKNYCSEDNYLFKVASTGLFIFKDRLVVVINEDQPLFEGRPFTTIESVLDVVLRIIYRSIFHFEEHLRGISMMSDQLEKEINRAMSNKHLLNMFTLEKSLVFYLKAINSNAKVIEKLRNNAARLGFTPEQLEFLDDIFIENGQCFEQAEVYSQVLSSLMDARASVVSNNLNVLMKVLTLVMICIMLPTLVISAFSMNVRLPLEQEIGTASFWIIMVLAGVSVAAVWVVWWWKKW
jgi:magnesium transporter